MPPRRRAAFLALTLITLCPSSTRAQADFAKETWTLHLYPSFIHGEAGFHGDEVEAITGTVGVGYYFDNDWGIYANLDGYAFEQSGLFNVEREGLGASLLMRWHFVSRDTFSLFIDGGGGLVRFDDEFPAQGTHANFTARLGFGATLQLADDLHLIGGVRYFHLSNAARHGMDENPSLDAAEGYIGLLFKL